MAGKKGVIIKALKLKFYYKKGKRNENEKDCDRHNLPDNYDVVELSGIVGENSGTVTDSAHFAKVYVGLDDFNFSEDHEDITA